MYGLCSHPFAAQVVNTITAIVDDRSVKATDNKWAFCDEMMAQSRVKNSLLFAQRGHSARCATKCEGLGGPQARGGTGPWAGTMAWPLRACQPLSGRHVV